VKSKLRRHEFALHRKLLLTRREELLSRLCPKAFDTSAVAADTQADLTSLLNDRFVTSRLNQSDHEQFSMVEEAIDRLDRGDVEWADLVVTMGCGDACPVLPGKRYVEWNLPDPAGLCLTDAREIRDAIARRVEELPL
jgi:protein-tyrosine-phosphatase